MKATQLVLAAEQALRLLAGERACRAAVLATDVALLDALDVDIACAEAQLAAVLPQTPAAVPLGLPGVSTVRASNYGAALGDPRRFARADAAYRIARMHPSTYDGAGRDRSGQKLSRRGSPGCALKFYDDGKARLPQAEVDVGLTTRPLEILPD